MASFLDLSREVRDMIYDYAVVDYLNRPGQPSLDSYDPTWASTKSWEADYAETTYYDRLYVAGIDQDQATSDALQLFTIPALGNFNLGMLPDMAGIKNLARVNKMVNAEIRPVIRRNLMMVVVTTSYIIPPTDYEALRLIQQCKSSSPGRAFKGTQLPLTSHSYLRHLHIHNSGCGIGLDLLEKLVSIIKNELPLLVELVLAWNAEGFTLLHSALCSLPPDKPDEHFEEQMFSPIEILATLPKSIRIRFASAMLDGKPRFPKEHAIHVKNILDFRHHVMNTKRTILREDLGPEASKERWRVAKLKLREDFRDFLYGHRDRIDAHMSGRQVDSRVSLKRRQGP